MNGARTLTTARLRVRPLAEDDLDGFHGVWGDPRVIFWGACPDRPASARRLAELLSRGAGRPWPVGWHALEGLACGRLLGDVMLQPAPFAPGELELGWHLAHEAWGRGYATEAAQALSAEAFSRLRLPRLVAAILPDNVRSAAVARRVGFERAGAVEHAGLAHDLWELRAPAQPRAART